MSTITSTIAIGPISQILPAQYRFAGDDWADVNAFVFTFYSVLPTFDQNGNQLTPGTQQNLAGCTFGGTLEYAPRPVSTYPAPAPPSPATIPLTGTVNVSTGQGTLTLSSSVTSTFAGQSPSVWANVIAGDSSAALFTLQARLTDSLGMTGTQAVIPLFVF